MPNSLKTLMYLFVLLFASCGAEPEDAYEAGGANPLGVGPNTANALLDASVWDDKPLHMEQWYGESGTRAPSRRVTLALSSEDPCDYLRAIALILQNEPFTEAQIDHVIDRWRVNLMMTPLARCFPMTLNEKTESDELKAIPSEITIARAVSVGVERNPSRYQKHIGIVGAKRAGYFAQMNFGQVVDAATGRLSIQPSAFEIYLPPSPRVKNALTVSDVWRAADISASKGPGSPSGGVGGKVSRLVTLYGGVALATATLSCGSTTLTVAFSHSRSEWEKLWTILRRCLSDYVRPIYQPIAEIYGVLISR